MLALFIEFRARNLEDFLSLKDFPQGAVSLDFFDADNGWVMVQTGFCEGDKQAPVPINCEQRWKLLATSDGGLTWHEIKLQ